MDPRGTDADPAGTPGRPAEIVEGIAFETVAIRRGSPRDGRWRLAALAALVAVVVAIGIPEPFRGAIPSSTGIWVFDATTLELLTIIPPAAVHDAVSMTSDGRYLLATGIPGLDDQSRPSEWSTSLSIFDGRDGHLVAQLGAAAANDDLGISLVWPPRPD